VFTPVLCNSRYKSIHDNIFRVPDIEVLLYPMIETYGSQRLHDHLE
jgi:hypothetical protein